MIPVSRGRGRSFLAAGQSMALAFVGLFLFASAPAHAADPAFPPLTGRVVDAAHVLTPDVISELTQRSAQIEGQSGRQLVVVTVPSLGGLEIDDYGYRLGRAWGIGEKGKNDGLILLVAPNERKVRIEVGYGLEGDVTDALTSVVINQKILPRFKAGDIPGGVQAGGDALADLLVLPSGELKDKSAAAASEPRQAATDRPHASHGIPIVFIVFVMFWVFSLIFGRRGGGGGGAGWLPWVILGAMSNRGGRDDDWGGGGGSGWGGGGGGGGGFSGGGGSFGGGGSSGSW